VIPEPSGISESFFALFVHQRPLVPAVQLNPLASSPHPEGRWIPIDFKEDAGVNLPRYAAPEGRSIPGEPSMPVPAAIPPEAFSCSWRDSTPHRGDRRKPHKTPMNSGQRYYLLSFHEMIEAYLTESYLA